MNIQFKNLETGEVVFNKDLLPSQIEFWNAKERYILLSGGYGCGKSMMLIIRTIYDAMRQDDNYILFGRKTYGEIHDVLLKDFFDICDPSWVVSFKKTPHPSVILRTFSGATSEIIFRNLDKFSENEIAGLNLGGVSIDQAEDIPENIFIALKGRMRRTGIEHRCYMTANPALSWLYRVFKEEAEPGYKIIEASTLENEANLPKEYIADLKKYPPALFKQFVLGIWDESLFAENAVFASEFLEKLAKKLKDPRQVKEGLEIFHTVEKHKGHNLQMGIDCAEGADVIEERYKDTKKDRAVITIVCIDCELELAKWAGRLPPNATADKAVLFASWYDNPLMVPEINSMGAALLNRLQDLDYTNIYRRHEFDKVLNKRLKKLGFRTTAATKAIMIERFNKRLRLCNPVIHSRDTYAEMKHFVYSDVAGKQGAGAQQGHHDDKVMSLLLAFYEDKDPVAGYTKSNTETTIPVETVPSLELTPDGKFKPPPFWRKEKTASWMTL